MARPTRLPRAKDVTTFSDGVWVTERTGVSRSRSARTGRYVSGVFGRRYGKSQSRTASEKKTQ